MLKNNNIDPDVLNFVKSNIDYDFNIILNIFDELSYFEHVGFVEVELSDHKNCFYPSSEFYIEKNNSNSEFYMKQDEYSNFHTLIFQKTGCCEDDYSGFEMYPLKDGTYWKIYFNC